MTEQRYQAILVVIKDGRRVTEVAPGRSPWWGSGFWWLRRVGKRVAGDRHSRVAVRRWSWDVHLPGGFAGGGYPAHAGGDCTTERPLVPPRYRAWPSPPPTNS